MKRDSDKQICKPRQGVVEQIPIFYRKMDMSQIYKITQVSSKLTSALAVFDVKMRAEYKSNVKSELAMWVNDDDD